MLMLSQHIIVSAYARVIITELMARKKMKLEVQNSF